MIQIGIRDPLFGSDDFDFHREHGIRWVTVDEVRERGVRAVATEMNERAGGQMYVSFDIDCVDPAFAPETGTPVFDGPGQVTALLAANLLFEFLSSQ